MTNRVERSQYRLAAHDTKLLIAENTMAEESQEADQCSLWLLEGRRAQCFCTEQAKCWLAGRHAGASKPVNGHR